MGFFYFYTMDDVKQYLDSTYLKTPEQANLSAEDNNKIVTDFVNEGISGQYKLVMIRPDQVKRAKDLITNAKSKLLVGTVIDFPEGAQPVEAKLQEAQQAIEDGADDLDFVVNYDAFKNGDIDLIKEEITNCTTLGLQYGKTVKWIIEVAALDATQIIQLTALIKNTVVRQIKEHNFDKVFVKSSTGFYKTFDGSPNGATVESIILMIENAVPLQVKASGGIRSFEDAITYINLGVKRIGTSSALEIVNGLTSNKEY